MPYSGSVTLTLGLPGQVVGSAHFLIQMNIWLKLIEIRERVKEIRSGHRIQWFCRLSHQGGTFE